MLNYETNTQFFQFQVCALILVCLIAGILSTSVHADPPAGNWDLIWSDEFDSGPTPEFPNSSNWGYEDGYKRNKEWQYYTNDIQNAYCQDGFLHIEAHQHPAGTYPTGSETGQDGSISSASLVSKDKIEHQYGWLEMRGRIDTQWGSWPAFWTLGSTGEWPDNGECDIMEYYRGRLKFNVAWWKTGDTQWSPRWDSETVYLSSLPSGWTDEFHVWSMEWTPEYVKLYMDGVLYNTWDASQDDNGGSDTSIEGFQQPHFIILNQAIGGTAGGDASGVVYPTNYEIDWVRWYQQEEVPSTWTKVDDRDPMVSYDANWGPWDGNPGYMGTETFCETIDGTATFNFTGSQGRYYGFKRNDLGYADIYIDDVYETTVDCYAGTSQYDVLLYESPTLPYGPHTLEIVVNGNQNASSNGSEVICDAFEYSQVLMGDLTLDGKVDMEDIAELGAGWQTSYDMNTLLDIADNWLVGIIP